MNGLTPDFLAAGDWLFAPIRLTRELTELLRGDAVEIAHGELPQEEQYRYAAGVGETVYGYFYLTDSGELDELNRHQHVNVFVETDGAAFYPLGGHVETRCPLADLSAEGRLFLISQEDFVRAACGGVPHSYLLNRLKVDRSREDPYRRLCERLNTRRQQSATHDALLRAACAGA